MDGCVRAGRLRAAESLLADMRAAGVPPNIVTFNILLRGYCASADSPLQAPHTPSCRLISPGAKTECALPFHCHCSPLQNLYRGSETCFHASCNPHPL
jgi:pentatricopeptide repeat protein